MVNLNLLGEDYPIFSDSPETSFLCDGRIAGYYADQEVKIVVFFMFSYKKELCLQAQAICSLQCIAE